MFTRRADHVDDIIDQRVGQPHIGDGLAHRGKLDGTPEVTAFAETLERVCVETVEGGQMTKDLALLVGSDTPFLTTEEFLAALDDNLRKAMG